MVVQPVDLSVGELALVEMVEGIFDPHKLPRDLASWDVLVGPVSTSQNFHVGVDSLHVVGSLSRSSEVNHDLL